MPNAEQPSYPTWIGFIYIFNLIVGTGALTLPAVFAKAGWLLSLIIIISIAVVSYITVTFIIEAMSCANAVRNWQNFQFGNVNEEDSDNDVPSLLVPKPNRAQIVTNVISPSSNFEDNEDLERIPLYSQHSIVYYNLNDKFELGEIAGLFFSEIGRTLFYLCIVIYLYGDLSIYSAAIAKSLRDIICDKKNYTVYHNITIYGYVYESTTNATCWENHALTRINLYRIFLIGFTLLFGPLTAFSLQKTKYFQIFTVIYRWLAFVFMIAIATKLLFNNGVQGQPVTANIYGLPSLFGACVYSFMCHHSLPGLLTPIHNKLKVYTIISYDYLLICLFYIILAMTGIFAFKHIEDLYTLNFIPQESYDPGLKTEILIIVDYFLALFPVFTLSTTFPIIAITLRNNLQTLFLDMTRFETYNFFVRRVLFPLCTVLPPFIITYFTESLTSLVSFTGSYAGAGIQYIIPISLVYYARNTCKELLGSGIVNEFESKFCSKYWLLFVLIWALASMGLVTMNFF